MAENTERLKLKVNPGTIAKPQDIGNSGARVVRFRGEDENGVVKTFETWSPELWDFIKERADKGETFPADVAYSEKAGGDGQLYQHWKVVQCYRADGAPVKARAAGGGGGKYYGKSPEERKSIEDQTRAYIIADLWKSGKIEEGGVLMPGGENGGQLIKKLVDWLNKLGEPLPAAPKKEEPTAPKPAEKKQAKEKPAPEETKGFANVGQFLKACLDNLGMNRSDVLEALNISSFDVLGDLNLVYRELVAMKGKP